MSTSTSLRGSSAPRAAAIDEEHPSPKASLRTASTPCRSTAARTSSAAPPTATSSWSNAHSRATPTAWPSRVPPSNGRSCFGRPRRRDPPAARTSPATKGSVGADGMPVPRGERGHAALAAEVDRLAVVHHRWRARDGGHGHAADRVHGRGGRAGGGGRSGRDRGAALAPNGDDAGEDRQRDLRRGAGADVEARRDLDAAEQLLGDAVAAQLADHAVAAGAAGDQAHVRQAGLEAGAQRADLVATVRRHDQRQVARTRLDALAGWDHVKAELP